MGRTASAWRRDREASVLVRRLAGMLLPLGCTSSGFSLLLALWPTGASIVHWRGCRPGLRVLSRV